MRLALAMIVLFLSALALTGQTTANSAQQKTVTKAEIEKLEAIADAKLEKLSYREKTTTFFKSTDGKPDYTSTRIIEHLRPDRNRMVFEDTGDESEGAHRSETIQIGNKEYSREGRGSWKVWRPKKPNRMTDIVDERKSYLIGIMDKDEILYLGKEDLNGRMADAYRLRTSLIDPKPLPRVRVVKKQWFDEKKKGIAD